jgi:signal transduction histidine kinase
MVAGVDVGNQTGPRRAVGISGTPRPRVACVGAVAVSFAIAMQAVGWHGYHQPEWAFALAGMVGLSFMSAGLVAWWKRPQNRTGPLMVLGGACWYLTNLQILPNPVAFALGFWLSYLDLVVFSHLALAYPDGRLTGRADRWIVTASYATYLGLQGARYLHDGGNGAIGWAPSPVTAWADVLSVVAIMVDMTVAVVVIRRWSAATPAMRRVHAPVWVGVLISSAITVGGAASSMLDLAPGLRMALTLAYGLVLVTLPAAFLSGLLRVRLARVRVADLVLQLEQAPSLPRLRDLLAGALGDSTLTLGLWSPQAEQYVDPGGRPVAVSGRGATYIADGAQRLAVLVHDPHLGDQRHLLDAAAATARLALTNTSLRASLQRQSRELESSRAAAAVVALDERRRLERDLHDGVQQRLLRLSWLAKRAGALVATGAAATTVAGVLDQLVTETHDTHVELRELAQGIHPAVVAEHGLAVAIDEYSLRAGIAVHVDIPYERWPAVIETTAYFVIVEAVVNAAKHAAAESVRVRVRQQSERLVIAIHDDGIGGADPRRGAGLRGMRERVAALNGSLAVDSAAGHGTRIVAVLPCA